MHIALNILRAVGCHCHVG